MTPPSRPKGATKPDRVSPAETRQHPRRVNALLWPLYLPKGQVLCDPCMQPLPLSTTDVSAQAIWVAVREHATTCPAVAR